MTSARPPHYNDWLFCFSNMTQIKMIPRKGELGNAQKIKTWAEVQTAAGEPPAPAEEVLVTLVEVEREILEVRRLEKVGRLLESSST